MESKWRFNVWDLGLSLGITTMCARSLSEPGKVIGGTVPTQSRYTVFIQSPNPNFGYVITELRSKPAGNKNFPYGELVEAD